MTERDETSTPSTLASDILARYRQVYRASREGEPLLRHGRRTVPVSTIAQQFYCEKAVQYSIEQPRAPTMEMLSGTAGHEAISSLGVTLSADQAVVEAAAVREEPICIYEFRVGWRHGDVTVLGFVDEAWFQDGDLLLVAERKFSGNPHIQRHYHIQAGLYCLGLGEMGFCTSHCRYRISVFKRECHDCGLLKSGACPGLVTGIDAFACDRGGYGSREFDFNREQVLNDLNWALGFWTWEREAQATEYTSRCRYCRYKSICDARPAPGA